MTAGTALFCSVGLGNAIDIAKRRDGCFEIQLRALSEVGFFSVANVF